MLSFKDEYIFYFDDNKIYRRTLAFPDPAGDNVAKTTCPPPSATPACPADDLIIDDIESFSLTHYDILNNELTSPFDYDEVTATQINLLLERSTLLGPVQIYHTILGTQRNIQ